MRTRPIILAGFVLASLSLLRPVDAGIVTIDFEVFNVGDGIAEINAVTAPLGLTFDAANVGSLVIDEIGGNKFLKASPIGDAADILINFFADVDFVGVDFIENPFKFGEATDITSLIATYIAVQNPNALVAGEFILSTHSFIDPATLTLRYSDVYFTPATPRFRALQMEQDGAVTSFVAVDNIVVEFVDELPAVPEPNTALLFGLGVICLIAANRRTRHRVPRAG